VMTLRFERSTATRLKVLRLLWRMASAFRAEDRERRAGRKSWRPAREVIARHPHLLADVVAGRTQGKRA
jgi:hypothetical protein